MEQDKNYLMIGVFVLALTVGLCVFAVWLTHTGNAKTLPYRIRFAESVSGLSVGSAVKFRGVDVGKVEHIAIDQVDTRLIRVDVQLDADTPVKTDTVASLRMQGVTGISFVELSGGSPEAQTLIPGEDGEPPEIRAEGSSISAIVDRMPELINKTSVVADQAAKLLGDPNLNAVNAFLVQAERITAALDRQTAQMENILINTSAMMKDMREITSANKQDVNAIAKNLRLSSEEMNKLLKRTNEAAGGSYEDLAQLLTEMKKASREIRQLAQSLEEKPGRLIMPVEEKGIPAP